MSQIEITPALLNDLRQKAEAATPGPWKVIETPRPDYSEDLRIVPCDAYGNSRGDGPIGDVFGGYKRPVAENAAHIAAASPAVVLALVAEVERLNVALDEILCQFDYQNNPKWRAEMKEAVIEMAKKKQDMRQLSGNETNFVSKGVNNDDQA